MKDNRKRIAIAALIVVLAGSIGAWLFQDRIRGSQSGGASSKVTIGVVLPLTGAAATYGNNALRGIQLAIKQVPALRDSRAINLAIEDSKSETKQAVGALQKLLGTDKIVAVVGDTSSSSVLAMAPVVQAANMVLISPCASAAEISKSGEYVFRTWQSDAAEGAAGARFAKETLNWRRVAVFYINNAYGQGLLESFKSAFVSGDRTVDSIPYPEGATDLRAQIGQLKSQKIDGIYLLGFPNELVLALRQMREQNVSAPILATQAIDDPAIYSRAKEAAEGVMFTTTAPPDSTSPAVQSFVKAYKAAFSVDPGLCSDSAFDAINLVVAGLNSGADGGGAMQMYLHGVHDYPGASGTINFNSTGDVVKAIQIYKISDGRAVAIGK